MKRILNSSIFVAKTRLGRNVKVVLFVTGAILPLGTLIWVALLAHGKAVTRRRDDEVRVGLTESASG